MAATLLVAAHGTRSESGSTTTRALVDAVAAARPDLRVELCFLDVASPSLRDALDSLEGDVVVMPLLLSSGYHVETDIPAVVAGRDTVRVSRHLGPHPLILQAIAERLAEVRSSVPAATTFLAAVPSSQEAARAEVAQAAAGLSLIIGRPVSVLPLGASATETLVASAKPVEVASYLLAEGAFLHELRGAAVDVGVVAEPIGVHPALVELVLSRYEETVS